MYAIEERTREVGGIEITTYKRDVVSANILEVEAGTNGYQGGDNGHGCRAYIRFEDVGGTAIDARLIRHGEGGAVIELGGDCELDTITEALEFAAHVLRDMTAHPYL